MFYLGTHMVSQAWFDLGVPLFVSRNRLTGRKTFPQPKTWWALDSGGFTELSLYGKWRTTPLEYVRDVDRFISEGMSQIRFVAPQDWMCEPFMLEKTGLTVREHQRRTVHNFKVLRHLLGEIVIPVLQGWERDDYLRCWEMYHKNGVELEWEPTVGLGSVCRRQNMTVAGEIVRALQPLTLHNCLHGFGVKLAGIESFGDALASADSMAWSFRARRDHPLPGCTHKSCANCPRYALRWYEQVQHKIGQQRLEVAA